MFEQQSRQDENLQQFKDKIDVQVNKLTECEGQLQTLAEEYSVLKGALESNQEPVVDGGHHGGTDAFSGGDDDDMHDDVSDLDENDA